MHFYKNVYNFIISFLNEVSIKIVSYLVAKCDMLRDKISSGKFVNNCLGILRFTRSIIGLMRPNSNIVIKQKRLIYSKWLLVNNEQDYLNDKEA